MAKKPTYEELEQKVKEFEKEAVEHNASQQALQLSEQRLSLIYDSVADILYYIRVEPDDCFRFLSINHAFLKATGLTRDQIVGKRIEEVIPETSVRLALDNYKKAIKENRIVRWEETSVYPAGEKIGHVSIAPVLNERGICTHLVGSVHDVTERKQAEETLRKSEEKYHHLSEGTFEAVVWHNKGKIIEANEQYYKMFGYKPEELVEKDAILLTVTPDSVKFMREQISLDHLGPYEAVGMKKDGTEFPMEIRAKMMKYKGQTARMAAIRDLTDPKRAGEALRDSEERFRMLFMDSPISLWEEDFSDVKKYIDSLRNSGLKDFRAYFENHPEDVDHCLQMVKILAVNRSTLDMYQAENNEEFLSSLEKVFTEESYDLFKEELISIAGGRKTFESEGITRTLKGERNNISLRWSVAPGHEETLSKVFVSIIDITDRKRAEESLQKAHNELEQRVKERTRDLELKTIKLEEINIAMKVLLEQSETHKKELEEKILYNIKELVDPYLEKLERCGSDVKKVYLSIIKSNIDEIISPFTRKLSNKYLKLTPSEIRIANLVKQGKTTKEMAGILNISGKTVGFHRENIRKKLGLKNKKANLRSHLLSLQ